MFQPKTPGLLGTSFGSIRGPFDDGVCVDVTTEISRC